MFIERKIEKPTLINGIEFIELIRLYENGSIHYGYLAKETEIQGIYCKDFLAFNPDGTISSCTLSRQQTINGVECFENDKLNF